MGQYYPCLFCVTSSIEITTAILPYPVLINFVKGLNCPVILELCIHRFFVLNYTDQMRHDAFSAHQTLVHSQLVYIRVKGHISVAYEHKLAAPALDTKRRLINNV